MRTIRLYLNMSMAHTMPNLVFENVEHDGLAAVQYILEENKGIN